MASKMCLNLVRRKFSSFSSPPCRRLYLTSSSSSSRSISSSSSLSLSSSWPRPTLMLNPEYDVTDKNEAVNFRFFSLGGADEEDGAAVKVMKRKVPSPLWDADCVGSSHGWLAYYNNREFGFYLTNLLCPPTTLSSSIPSPEIIPLPSFPPYYYYSHDAVSGEPHVSRVVLTSAPDNNNNKDNNSHIHKCGGCAVVVRHQWFESLSFCRLGRDESWIRLADSRLSDYEDFIYSNKNQLLYVLSESTGDIEAWDLDLLSPGKPKPQRIELPDIDYAYPHHLKPYGVDKRALCLGLMEYLVESPSGDILRVRRYATIGGSCNAPSLPSIRFDVCKLDFERGKGEYVRNLGDTALFLGLNHSFALSSGEYPELSPNSIYFVDNLPVSNLGLGKHLGGQDMGVYNLKSRTVAPLFPSELIDKKILPPLLWLAPNPNPHSN